MATLARKDPAELKWAPGTQPVSLCMACQKEVFEWCDTCPQCQIPVAHVRMCPDCKRWVAAVHTQCVYCGRTLLIPPDDAAEEAEPTPTTRSRKPLRRHLRPLVFSGIVFLSVFSGLLYLTRIYEKPDPPKPHKIASSYALRRASIYSSPSLTGAAIGHVDPGGIVDIIGFAGPGLAEHWLRIASPAVSGYTAMRDFAPPKPVNDKEGYPLLRSFLLVVDNPSVMPLADESLSYYRRAFPSSPYREELAWLVAERARQLSERSATARLQLLPVARKRYKELAAGGGAMAEEARKRLDKLPGGPIAHVPQGGAGRKLAAAH
jgi:hypothetical protein